MGDRRRRRRLLRGALEAPALLLFVVTVAPAAAAAPAATLYVDSPGCSDTGPGTATQPYCTISAAAKVAVAGQTVQVGAGTYAEQVRPTNSGAATAPLTFTAAPGASVTVTGAAHSFDLSSRNYVNVTGFTSANTTSSGIYLNRTGHANITNNTVTAAGKPVSGLTAVGIYLGSTTDTVVQGNATYGNSGAGIYLTNGTTRVTVDGNDSHDNANGFQRAATGIDIRSAGNVITRNRVHNNEDSGLQLYPGGDDNLVIGNVAYDNKGFTTTAQTNCDKPPSGAAGCIIGDHGIDSYGTRGNTLIGNTVYNNVAAGINVEGVKATHSVSALEATDTTITVGSASGFPLSGSFLIQVDAERMTVTAGQGTTTWTVTRGADGTSAAPHPAGCDGTACTPKNLNVLQQAGFRLENNISVDNAILCPDGYGGVKTPCSRTKGEIRVDQYSRVGSSADNNLFWTSSTTYPYVYVWGNPTYSTLAALQTATGQELHGTQANPLWASALTHDFHLTSGSPAIDSADSAAPGELGTDAVGAARVDDPATTDTGYGPRTYDDRGAFEYTLPVVPAP